MLWQLTWKTASPVDANHISDSLLAYADCVWVEENARLDDESVVPDWQVATLDQVDDPFVSFQQCPEEIPCWRAAIIHALCSSELQVNCVLIWVSQQTPQLGKCNISIPDTDMPLPGVPSILEFAWLEVITNCSKHERQDITAWQPVPLLHFHNTSTVQHVMPIQKPSIVVPAGLAFGTGTHPTTAMVLNWCSPQRMYRKSVLDYGCGSGILGIAAAKLGAKMVCAVDHDNQALEATQANVQRNYMSEKFSICTPCQFTQLFVQKKPVFDVVLANILLQPLIALYMHITKVVVPGGYALLTGIISSQRQALMQTWCKDWHEAFIDPRYCRQDLQTTRFDDWDVVVLIKKS